MTLNTDTHDTSDLTDAEIQTVLDLVGSISQSDSVRTIDLPAYKAYILLARSLKVSHPKVFKDPDVAAVRAILVEESGPHWNAHSDSFVKRSPLHRAYMAGKAAPR